MTGIGVHFKWKLTRIFITAGTLFGGWMLFTWSMELQSLLLGLFFSVIVSLFTYSLFIDDSEASKRSLLPHLHFFGVFSLVLLWNIYTASFRVAASIVTGRINPRIVHFRTRLRSDFARAVLANAITLTPGTITLDLDEDHLVVHWLNAKTTHSGYAGKIIKGRFEALLRRIWS